VQELFARSKRRQGKKQKFSSGVFQVIYEEKDLLVVVSFCEHQTFFPQKLGILWPPRNVKLLNLVSQVLKARSNQGLKINFAHVLNFE
jgi:hypothetical protein